MATQTAPTHAEAVAQLTSPGAPFEGERRLGYRDFARRVCGAAGAVPFATDDLA